MTDRLSNSLTALADRVRAANGATEAARRSAIENALETGSLLIEAKASCRHGEWLPFLERARVGERAAQNYMVLARSGLEIRTVADLGGIKAALAFGAQWQLPAFDDCMAITGEMSAAADKNGDPGPLAFVWQSGELAGHYHIGVLAEDAVSCTKWPMKPMIEVEGHRPVNAIIHWLSLYFSVPISDWELGTLPRRFPVEILSPFLTDGSFVSHPKSGGCDE